MDEGMDVGGWKGARDGCCAGGAEEGAPRGLRGGGGGAAGRPQRPEARENLPTVGAPQGVRRRSWRARKGGAAVALVVAGRVRVLRACGAQGRAHREGKHQPKPSTPRNQKLAPGEDPWRQPTAWGVPKTPPAICRRGAVARWVRESMRRK